MSMSIALANLENLIIMFSSFTNTTSTTMTSFNMSPFPPYYYLPSSSSSSPNQLLQPQLQEHDMFLHQIHQFYDPSFFPPHSQTFPDALVDFEARAAPVAPKKAAKKDRHSKIHTAQGLRDRRVRLSIEIARQFFDLHDVLGFDKASKTLEWLLRKSRKAIEELSSSSAGSKSLKSCPDSECDQAGSEVNEDVEPPALPNDVLEKAASDGNNVVSEEASLASLVAVKESRAKARERARERTKEKRFKWKNVIEKPQIPGKIGSPKNVFTENHHNVVIVNKKNYLKCPYDDPNNNNNNKAIYSSSWSSILPPNWDKNCTAFSQTPNFGVST